MVTIQECYALGDQKNATKVIMSNATQATIFDVSNINALFPLGNSQLRGP